MSDPQKETKVLQKGEKCEMKPELLNEMELRMQRTDNQIESLMIRVDNLTEAVDSKDFESLLERLKLMDYPTKSDMIAIIIKLIEEKWEECIAKNKSVGTAEPSYMPRTCERLNEILDKMFELNKRIDVMEHRMIMDKSMEDRLLDLKVQIEEVSRKSISEENKVLIDTKQELDDLAEKIRSNEQQTNLKIENLEKKLLEVTKQNEKLQASINESNVRMAKLTSLLDQTNRKNQTTTAQVDNMVNKVEELAMQSKKAGPEKITVSTGQLSAEAGGRRILRSYHGTFLRAVEPEWRVDMVNRPPKEWENWYFEDCDGKVVLKGRGAPDKPGQFLRAHPNGVVDLVGTAPREWEMWKPLRNDDDSWSLLSAHGTWLSARDDGSVTTVDTCREWEHFWLDRW